MSLKKNFNFGALLLVGGLLSQMIVYLITKDSFLSFISGMAGMISVVQCSERKLSFYFWSFIQLFTYTIICYQEALYGKLIENSFYFLTMLIGLFIWWRNLDKENLVKPKSLETTSFIGVLVASFGLIIIGYVALTHFNDPSPFLDSTTTILGISAQILMMLRYKENWVLWFIQDIICLLMWVSIENWYMVLQYVFWSINTIYGFVLWKRNI